MSVKEKIMGGAVILLLAITFLPAQVAWAGVVDYIKSTDTYKTIKNYTTSASNYITTSRPYNYITTSRPYNFLAGTSASAVSALTKGLGFDSMAADKTARQRLTPNPISFSGLIERKLGGISDRLSTLSDTIGEKTGLWESKPKFNGAFIYMTMSEVITETVVPNNSSVNPRAKLWDDTFGRFLKKDAGVNETKKSNYTPPFEGFGTPMRSWSEVRTTIMPKNESKNVSAAIMRIMYGDK